MSPSQLSRQITALYLADAMFTPATEAAPTTIATAKRPPAVASSTPAALEALTGSYHSEELGVTFHVTKMGIELGLQRETLPAQVLTRVGNNVFRAGASQLSFQGGNADQAAAFTLDSGRVRGLLFTRQ